MPGEVLRVLIIDDEKDFAVTLAQRLELRNFAVQWVLTGELGLEVLKDTRIDVALVDSQLPGLSGEEIAQQIKRISSRTRVIMLTGSGLDSESNGVMAKQLKIEAYLCKPVDLPQLLEAIGACTQRTK